MFLLKESKYELLEEKKFHRFCVKINLLNFFEAFSKKIYIN